MKDVIVIGVSNFTPEGITLRLNKPARVKGGSMRTQEWWVSWDKIGFSLFENYTEETDIKKLDELRKK